MQAYLIDPIAERVSVVDYDGDYNSIYKLIDCSMFDLVNITHDGDAIFVDDEGLFKRRQWFFEYLFPNGRSVTLAGRGLVLGVDHEGESVSPKIDLEELTSRITFKRDAVIPAGGITTYDDEGNTHCQSFGDDIVYVDGVKKEFIEAETLGNGHE